jgi:uncharacterized membrane protein YccF (DUF307 family)
LYPTARSKTFNGSEFDPAGTHRATQPPANSGYNSDTYAPKGLAPLAARFCFGASVYEATPLPNDQEVPMNQVVIKTRKSDPGCLVQIAWFVFIGWWAGQIWIALAWLLMVTIIGIPLGVKMMNQVPRVIALRGESETLTVRQVGDETLITTDSRTPQHNIILRAIYLVLIGWWLSAIWMETAYAVCLTIIGLPVGFWMFDQVPALVSLRRS